MTSPTPITPPLPLLLPLLPLLLLLSPLALALPPPLPALSSYANRQPLDDSFNFFWTFIPSPPALNMAVQAKTDGWVGLGFSEVGAMIGTDAMVGWVKDGQAVATDRFIFGKDTDASGLALDSQQDFNLLGGQEAYNNSDGYTWTTLHFSRLLNTSDCNDRVIQPGEHVSLIWALGSRDDLSYHGISRGGATIALVPGTLFSIFGPPGDPAAAVNSTTVTGAPPNATAAGPNSTVTGPNTVTRPQPLSRVEAAAGNSSATTAPGAPVTVSNATTGPVTVSANGTVLANGTVIAWNGRTPPGVHAPPGKPTSAPPPPPAPAGDFSFADKEFVNFTTRDYSVPQDFTNYVCNTYQLPYTSKVQVVEWGLLFNGTNLDMLHHAVVYGCNAGDTPPPTPNFPCEVMEFPWGCSNVVAVWTVGGKNVVLPPNVGLPLGPGSAYRSVVFQMHYTNPSGVTGVRDSSGVYFRLSQTPLPVDAGFLTVGPFNWQYLIRIPGQQPSWTEDSVCPSECSSLALTSSRQSNITIVGSILHQHTRGRQVYTDLYRGGQRLLTVNRQDYYDFAFQQYKDLSPGVFMLPGDELHTRCVWNTSGVNTVTMGGGSTKQEMCINFLLVYPMPPTLNFHSCFNACASVDLSAGRISFDPSAPGLSQWAQCSDSVFLPLNRPCHVSYGANLPLETIAGCPQNTAPSLSQTTSPPSGPPVATTVAATPGPSLPSSPRYSCRVRDGSGMMLVYQQCRELNGGYTLLWNRDYSGQPGISGGAGGAGAGAGTASRSETGAGSGTGSDNGSDNVDNYDEEGTYSGPTNVTLSMMLSGPGTPGWVAFGFSPTGRMVGSSVVAGLLQLDGATGAVLPPQSAELYLGGYSVSLILPGSLLKIEALSFSLESGRTVLRANISIPLTMAVTPQSLVLARGPVTNGVVGQHSASDAHVSQFLALNCSSLPPNDKAAGTACAQAAAEAAAEAAANGVRGLRARCGGALAVVLAALGVVLQALLFL